MTTDVLIDHGVLRFMTCGSVDDGKSTLIGRLLLDSRMVLADALSALAASSRRRGLEELDPSLLTDGLEAEREQGITIDVAYRYFTTGRRKYILADTPGHEQYTRNMATGASTADLAIVLVDARKGILPQTRRHLAIAHLMGIDEVVVAVNKMDLVGWDEGVFRAHQAEAAAVAARLGQAGPSFLPLSALRGDMVVDRGNHLPWYRGGTLLELLEAAPPGRRAADGPLRFPVQGVCRPRRPPFLDFRGYQGRVESGSVATGDAVQVLPGGGRTRVADIVRGGGGHGPAVAGESVTLVLEDDLDLARGDLLASGNDPLRPTQVFRATLCWMDERPLSAVPRLLLRHGPREVRARVTAIHGRLDVARMSEAPALDLGLNDLATVTVETQRPIAPDPYRRVRAGGAFILVDEAGNATVAAGMVLDGPEVGGWPGKPPC